MSVLGSGVFGLQRALCSLYYEVCSVQCSVCSVQCAMFQFVVCSVQFAMCSAHGEVCSNTVCSAVQYGVDAEECSRRVSPATDYPSGLRHCAVLSTVQCSVQYSVLYCDVCTECITVQYSAA